MADEVTQRTPSESLLTVGPSYHWAHAQLGVSVAVPLIITNSSYNDWEYQVRQQAESANVITGYKCHQNSHH
jgi:hypothetical protein